MEGEMGTWPRWAIAFLLAIQPVSGSAQDSASDGVCQPEVSECRAFPTASSIEEAFLHLQIAIGALNDRAQFDPEISKALKSSVHAQVIELQGMFLTTGGAAADPEYVDNLDLTASALMAAVEEEDASVANATLDVLQRDLQIKLASARATMGAEGGKPKKIPATIVTRRGTATVKGYRIKLAEGLRTAWPPKITFDQLSNPGTERRITPGVYLVYAYLDGAVAGKELLDIGLAGETAVTLDLQVK
jgi:hypothetical protein